MAGVVSAALYGPGGVRDLVASDPRRALVMDETVVIVEAAPTDFDRQLADTEDDQYLLGLWTYPPQRIQLFASDIIATGYDPVDVAVHELGHAWGMDHGAHCPSCSVRGTRTPHVHREGCPVCLLHDHTAIAMALMDGLRLRSFLEHVIPAGLGGTIPEAQWRIRQAMAEVPRAAPLLDDPTKIRHLSRSLERADQSLSGWLGPEDVSRAYHACRVAWDAAYDCGHAYYAAHHVG